MVIPLTGWRHLTGEFNQCYNADGLSLTIMLNTLGFSGTSWYDQAHSETVLEGLDFDWDDQTKWYCILGGSQQLAKRMENDLVIKPTYGVTATAIRVLNYNQVEVEFTSAQGLPEKRSYAGVFNSTTLGCLKRMDTTRAGLNYATKQAMRSLGYGPSTKAAIKFRRAWWIHDLGSYSVKQGGLGHSDLNIRTCVYPSYNINDPSNEPAVLLCSYTWQQDAERVGALVTNDDPQRDTELKELLIRDLASLHQNPEVPYEKVYEIIKSNWMEHHAHDWVHDPRTVGAFAFFRPQQFSGMWNKLIHLAMSSSSGRPPVLITPG
jgi:monoamine oxidase